MGVGSMVDEETVEVRAVLKGEPAKKAMKLKDHYGVVKYAELVRILVEKEYKEKYG